MTTPISISIRLSAKLKLLHRNKNPSSKTKYLIFHNTIGNTYTYTITISISIRFSVLQLKLKAQNS